MKTVHWSLFVKGHPFIKKCGDGTSCGVEMRTNDFATTHDPTQVTCKTCLRGTDYKAWLSGHGNAIATKEEAYSARKHR
jgi:hypothetical protein